MTDFDQLERNLRKSTQNHKSKKSHHFIRSTERTPYRINKNEKVFHGMEADKHNKDSSNPFKEASPLFFLTPNNEESQYVYGGRLSYKDESKSDIFVIKFYQHNTFLKEESFQDETHFNYRKKQLLRKLRH